MNIENLVVYAKVLAVSFERLIGANILQTPLLYASYFNPELKSSLLVFFLLEASHFCKSVYEYGIQGIATKLSKLY
jgi:hypothetical protein